MSRLAWITGDTLPDNDFICRRVRIPRDDIILANVNGALWSLCEIWNWEKVGTVTTTQAVEAMQVMYNEFIQGEACLIGAILPYATKVVPDGCLACDGTQYLRTDYPMLYAALEDVYIVDADNFITPDLRGRTVIGNGEGVDLTPREMGDTGGEETHTLLTAELAAHTHETDPHSHTNTPHSHLYDHVIPNIDVESAGVPDPVAVGQPFYPASTSAESVSIDNETVVVNASGEDVPHNNMQPFHTLRYCIVSR